MNVFSFRWKTAEPVTVQLSEVGQQIESIYANDGYVFCGIRENSKVRVYDFASGRLIRELTPSWTLTGFSLVVGGKGIVAALINWTTVTIWSSQGQMEKLAFFNSENFNCPNASCGVLDRRGIQTIQVVGTNKLAMLSNAMWQKVSLIVLEKGDCTWDTKVLGCWEIESWAIRLASDGEWLAVLDGNKVKLWRGHESGQDDLWKTDLWMSNNIL